MNLKKGITHFSVALEKIQKFRIQTNFRHRGKQAGLLLRTSQSANKPNFAPHDSRVDEFSTGYLPIDYSSKNDSV
jgi:hypothetical protein